MIRRKSLMNGLAPTFIETHNVPLNKKKIEPSPIQSHYQRVDVDYNQSHVSYLDLTVKAIITPETYPDLVIIVLSYSKIGCLVGGEFY